VTTNLSLAHTRDVALNIAAAFAEHGTRPAVK
jgi:hypothetical protein